MQLAEKPTNQDLQDLTQINRAPELSQIGEGTSESLSSVAHDARNMVTALGLYCDLLDEPGVLLPAFRHYGSELKMLASASRRLVDKLARLDGEVGAAGEPVADSAFNFCPTLPESKLDAPQTPKHWVAIPPTLIRDLAWELQSNRNLLAALAGPAIAVSVDTEGGAYPVGLTSEDLTRILVNMVKNAVEAMPDGGRLHLTLREGPTAPGDNPMLILNIEDNGPGIPLDAFERIFEPGYSTHSKDAHGKDGWQADHRGLGLAITRSIILAAGGTIHAANRDPLGACFQIELPARTT